MFRKKSVFLLASMLSSSVFMSTAIAQGTETKDEIVIQGKVLFSDQVNAVKTPTPIINVPQSLSIVTAEEISERGFTSISDIINYIPGVNTTQGEGHRDALVFRGVRSTADFFVDGIRDDVQYYRPFYNLEQVEVLRGPNALLFGRGGTGGIVNRVTKKGVIGEQFTGYQLGINSFGGYDGSVDVNIATGENSALRVNAYYEHLDNHRDFFDGDNYGLNPTLKVHLSPATTLDVSYEYANHERFIDRGIPTGADGRPVEAFQDIVFGDPALNTAEFEAHILRAAVQHEFADNLKGNFTIAYGDYDKLYQNFYVSGYTPATSGVAEEFTIDGYVDTTQRERLTLAGNLISEFKVGNTNHTFIVGAEYLDTGNDNTRQNARWSTTDDDNEVFLITRPIALSGGVGTNASGDATINDFFQTAAFQDKTNADVKVSSVYMQDQIELNAFFQIILGARFDSFDFSVDVFDAADASRNISRKDEEISPRAGLIFKPQENVSFYASYSESFLPRSGGQFASISDDDVNSSAFLDPDVYEQSEIGVKWDFASAMSLTAAYFQNDQTRADRNQITEEEFEVRGLEVTGFEIQLEGQVTEQFYLTAGYSNLDGETDQGREIPREVPENMFSMWGNYDVNEKFGVGLGATYQDESFIVDFDLPASGSADDPATHPTLLSYTRIDAAAYYNVSETLAVRLNIENLTDELYFPSAHSTHQATVGEPLNARLSLSGQF